ncbi:hypothetical protein TraAM80_07194 [Trypanosoma rangeli]|uniref:Uncharacterized protein n=1 Tax=Trypanosoma rangeli TaxID=5698 RepID=A0A3R7K7B4_TRYRA|nr:uncharacterized protein TraAM80_07194 [Trypanosoma rangeli]RNF01144.1 hypothetical protein TraAM80_07194 [Trypanosoma rangeli]|eukprot:RNF01144.1 hypothetical protein TraAM80_07194 [Trypanosoma rangeli]
MGPSHGMQRSRPNAGPTSGNHMSLVEPPDLTQHLQFGMNNMEYVMVPDVPEERRNRTDVEKEREMQHRFGEYGPGERLVKSSQQTRRDMLQEQQDVDGLPWEMRWRREMIPTAEEMIQEVRDRFDLYIRILLSESRSGTRTGRIDPSRFRRIV